MAPSVTSERPRRPSRPRSRLATSAATIAMFQPEIATTWLTPAVVNAAARSRSTRSRRPMRIPAASPASGSGSARVSASPEPRRAASTTLDAVPSVPIRSSVRGSERGDDADPAEVGRRTRHRRPAAPRATADRDPIARGDLRVARERGRDAESGGRRAGPSRPAGRRAANRRRPPGGPRSAPIGPDRFGRAGAGVDSASRTPMRTSPTTSGGERSPGRRGTEAPDRRGP